jgi:hypothetical protein
MDGDMIDASVYGPSLLVDVGCDPTFTPEAPTVPMPRQTGVWGLVDTGAMMCCLDSVLADKLNLSIVGQQKALVGFSDSPQNVNIYRAQIRVPTLHSTIHGSFAGFDMRAAGQVHEVLLGRTFLRHFVMTYVGFTGAVSLVPLTSNPPEFVLNDSPAVHRHRSEVLKRFALNGRGVRVECDLSQPMIWTGL